MTVISKACWYASKMVYRLQT